MPCRSDYMEPNNRERELRETAELYQYAMETVGDRVPERVAQAAKNAYCTDDFVPHLCEYISDMSVDMRRQVVYNAYDAKSRRLADWWERHQAADKARLAKEAEAAEYIKTIAGVFEKLDSKEVAALRKYFNG